MKKNKLKKLALLGITGGVLAANQATVEANVPSNNVASGSHIAKSCGASCGSPKTAYNDRGDFSNQSTPSQGYYNTQDPNQGQTQGQGYYYQQTPNSSNQYNTTQNPSSGQTQWSNDPNNQTQFRNQNTDRNKNMYNSNPNNPSTQGNSNANSYFSYGDDTQQTTTTTTTNSPGKIWNESDLRAKLSDALRARYDKLTGSQKAAVLNRINNDSTVTPEQAVQDAAQGGSTSYRNNSSKNYR